MSKIQKCYKEYCKKWFSIKDMNGRMSKAIRFIESEKNSKVPWYEDLDNASFKKSCEEICKSLGYIFKQSSKKKINKRFSKIFQKTKKEVLKESYKELNCYKKTGGNISKI